MEVLPENLHGRIHRLYVEEDYLWCQGYNARNVEGHACEWNDENANEFCLLGALYRVYFETYHWTTISTYLAKIFNNAFWEESLLTWNDQEGRTYGEVLDFLIQHKL